jgi:hypothetical protein
MLSLNYLFWEPFENMFDGLAGSKITKIELSNSYLTPFDGMWFQNLSSLKLTFYTLLDSLMTEASRIYC